MVREKEVNVAEIWPLRSHQLYFRRDRKLGLPCSAGGADGGNSANLSRSLRTEEDCFKAALKREFFRSSQRVRYTGSWRND